MKGRRGDKRRDLKEGWKLIVDNGTQKNGRREMEKVMKLRYGNEEKIRRSRIKELNGEGEKGK